METGKAREIFETLKRGISNGKYDAASPMPSERALMRRFTAEKGGTFWLSETPEEPGSIGWGAACPRVCSWLVLREVRRFVASVDAPQ